MKQHENKKSRGKGEHFDSEQREVLETLVLLAHRERRKLSCSELARIMNKHRTTISRELKRGYAPQQRSDLSEYQIYSAEKAQQSSNEKAAQKGRRMKLNNRHLERLRYHIIEQKRSPYTARILMIKEGLKNVPCLRSIYYAIDSGETGICRTQLPYRRKKCKSGSTRRPRMGYHTSPGRSISERAEEAEDRKQFGHWEMDTVAGGRAKSNACLLVFTERKSRYELIARMPDRTQRSVTRTLKKLRKKYPGIFDKLLTLTCDNGSEFLDPDAIESALGKGEQVLFYAHPFSAFERGSNENANRLIRRHIPKGADIGKFTHKQVQQIQDWINQTPRAILDDQTAQTVLDQAA